MTDRAPLDTHADEPFAYLTTIGRRTGEPHRIEIWFAVHGGRIFLISGGRDRSDWVRNVIANGRVRIELGGETYVGTARVAPPEAEDDALARELLVAKYATPANPLADWKRRSLPVVVEFDGVDAVRTISEGASR